MSDTELPQSTIELPASPHTVISFGAGNGSVITHQGSLSIDEAVQLMVRSLASFDWSSFEPQDAARDAYEDAIDIVSLVAEINLYLARLLWTLNVPGRVGMPRMLSPAAEAPELRYLENLAAQRSLMEDELAWHLLEHGEFMSDWAVARRCLVPV